MNKLKIKNSESCPCGSGIVFKDCCKGKPSKIKPSKIPLEVQVMERMRASMKKCCLHPDKEKCKGKIKAAHALQNNKIISLLSGKERHIYMMDAKKQPILVPLETGEVIPIVKMSKTSANDATTETCFCDYHDNIAFSVIEKGAPDFDVADDEMKFVYAYKAFIFEYYKQQIALDVFRQNFKETPAAFIEKDTVALYRMLLLKMREFEPVKNHFDKQILAGTHMGVYTCAVKIQEKINFADYAYIAPDYDMNGKKIKHTKKGIMHRLAITIFPETSCSWLLLSCLDDEVDIYIELFSQFESSSENKIKFYLNMILPLYSENIVLSPSLWTNWSSETQMAYTYYANLNGKDAVAMGRCIGYGLKNASKDKTGQAYKMQPKINLFE